MQETTKPIKPTQKTNSTHRSHHIGRSYSTRKQVRKLFSVLLTLCLLGGILPAQSAAYAEPSADGITVRTQSYGVSNPRIAEDSTQESGQVVTYDTIYFGSYPQSEVTGADLTAAITGAVYDEKQEATVAGVKYRRMKYTDAMYYLYGNIPGVEGDVTEYCYNWKTGGDAQGYHYFRYEPIRWRVLSVNGNDAFLLADTALDTQRYHKEWEPVTWETCTLRSYLNGSFLNCAFTAAEQQAVYSSTLENADNSKYGTEGGNATTDMVFLLSESDMYKEAYGFCSNYDEEDEARRCRPSEYGFAMGSLIYSSEIGNAEAYNGNGWWWRRSPGYGANDAADVSRDGWVNRNGGSVTSTTVVAFVLLCI